MSGESIPVQRIRGVIYARFSCGHQNEKSIEGQVEDCRAFAREQGVEIVNVYVDRAMTATNDRRPAFQKMIMDSRAHLFETVVVWKSDRFSRNTADAPRYRKELEENGVSLLSVTEPNIEGPERILFNAMNDGYNAYYSAELSVKIKRGNRINVEKGIFNGGRIPYGYDDVGQRLAINQKEAEVVKEIFGEYSSSGITLNALRVALKARGIRNRSGNPFSHGSLYNMLRNRTYLGEYTKGGVTNPKAFPAIVNAEVFAKASSRLRENAKKSTSFRSEETDTFLLTGKLCCGKCGSLMVGDSGKVRNGKPAFKYYACHNRKRRKDCDMKPVRKELIEDYVVSETSKWVNDSGFLDALADAVYSLQFEGMPLIKSAETEIAQVQAKMDNIMRAVENGMDSEDFGRRYAELKDRRTELNANLDRMRMEHPTLTREQIAWYLKSFRSLGSGSLGERKRLIDVFVNTVYLYEDGAVDICYNWRPLTERVANAQWVRLASHSLHQTVYIRTQSTS